MGARESADESAAVLALRGRLENAVAGYGRGRERILN